MLIKCVFVFNSVLYLSFLNEIGQHNNNRDVLFANHSQEIRNGHVIGALCCDVGTTSINALKESRKVQSCNLGCQKIIFYLDARSVDVVAVDWTSVSAQSHSVVVVCKEINTP